MTTHKKPQGHSNIYADETEPWTEPGDPARACIPLTGGARVDTYKPLPPLSLSRKEWTEIGFRMRWCRRPKPSKDIREVLSEAEISHGFKGFKEAIERVNKPK